MATDTPVKTFIINKMTQAKFAAATKSKTEAYVITDAPKTVNVNDFMSPITSTNKGATKTQIDALDDKIDIASTSGKIIGSYWFGKTKADTAVPAPTLPGQNYYDFTTSQVYKSTDGATWTLDGTNVPPTDIDAQIMITSKFWDITEQENQHGGKAWWSHTNSKWSYSPTIYEDKPAGGASLPLLTRLISDHQFNDVSYLDANPFSWQSGSVYKAAYEHLVNEAPIYGVMELYCWTDADDSSSDSSSVYSLSPSINIGDELYQTQKNTNAPPFSIVGTVEGLGTSTSGVAYVVMGGKKYLRNEEYDGAGTTTNTIKNTFAGIEIRYRLAEDGHRICLPNQETAVSNLYAKTGEANFFILDIANAQFKLPRTQKRKLIRAVKNGDSWYNLYSDGWVEQGGKVPTGGSSITFLIKFRDTNYYINAHTIANTETNTCHTALNNLSATGCTIKECQYGTVPRNLTGPATWQAEGYAAESVLANEPVQYEYYYVGNFEQTAIEQTAGLNAELFNAKADISAVPGLVMPDYANSTVWLDPTLTTVPTTEQSFIAPKTGVINVVLTGLNGNKAYVYVNDVLMGQTAAYNANYATVLAGQYLVPTGATVRFKPGTDSQVIGTQQVIFYPLIGAK